MNAIEKAVELEREILFTVSVKPELQEETRRYTVNIYRGLTRRKIAQAISALTEDREKIDDGTISSRSGLTVFEVNAELSYHPPLSAAAFSMKVNQLVVIWKTREMYKLLEPELKSILKTGEPDAESRARIRELWREIDELEEDNGKGNGKITLAERGADSIKVKPITYLWRNVFPAYMSTALTGDPGEGKSLVVTDATARTTTGTPFPAYGEAGQAVKGHVFYVTSEGVPEIILVPRLIAAGADLNKVTIIEGVRLNSGEFSVLDVTAHLPMIASRAKDFPDLRLIVIDPIASFIPERINPNQTNTVRQMMDRISDLAYQLGVAAVTVMHFSKAAGVKAGQRTAGSGQFGAAVKMSWSVIRREGDPRNSRLLVPQKSNITGGHESLSFGIREVQFPSPDDPAVIIKTAKIEYGALIDEDPETLISPLIESDNNVASAVRFLRHKLAGGTTLYAKPLIDEAEEGGIPKWALYKAKDRLGVQHDKESTFQGRTFWYQPKDKKE